MTSSPIAGDLAARVASYNEPSPVADAPAYRARWWETSAVIRANPASKLDLRYGSRPRACVDYFPSGVTHAPLFVFVHGGYWQRNEKERFAFVSSGPHHHGIDVALVGYTLAPDARLTEIVAEIRESLTFLADHAGELGFDRQRVVLGGWSAGGHLTAVALDHPLVRAGLSVSGLFDLEPIAPSSLNDKLALDAGEIEMLSPLKNWPVKSKPLLLFVGGDEKAEMKRQSADYAAAAQSRKCPVSLTVLSGHHHFSILDEFAADGALTRGLLTLVDRV